jgi:hypothetical protein
MVVDLWEGEELGDHRVRERTALAERVAFTEFQSSGSPASLQATW